MTIAGHPEITYFPHVIIYTYAQLFVAISTGGGKGNEGHLQAEVLLSSSLKADLLCYLHTHPNIF